MPKTVLKLSLPLPWMRFPDGRSPVCAPVLFSAGPFSRPAVSLPPIWSGCPAAGTPLSFPFPGKRFGRQRPAFRQPSGMATYRCYFRTVFLHYGLQAFQTDFQFRNSFRGNGPVFNCGACAFHGQRLHFLLDPFKASVDAFQIVFLFHLSKFFRYTY